MCRELYELLTEFSWVQDPTVRKKVSVLLDGEGVTEPVLRKRLMYLRRPEAMLTVLNPKRKTKRADQERNTLRPEEVDRRAREEIDYVRERVLFDGIDPQMVAAQMGWPTERVLEITEVQP